MEATANVGATAAVFFVGATGVGMVWYLVVVRPFARAVHRHDVDRARGATKRRSSSVTDTDELPF